MCVCVCVCTYTMLLPICVYNHFYQHGIMICAVPHSLLVSLTVSPPNARPHSPGSSCSPRFSMSRPTSRPLYMLSFCLEHSSCSASLANFPGPSSTSQGRARLLLASLDIPCLPLMAPGMLWGVACSAGTGSGLMALLVQSLAHGKHSGMCA